MGTEAVTSRFSSWAQDIQWNAVGQEAAQLLGRYIRVNTANPPGNEGEAARFLSEILSGEGLHADIHESAPGRANLVARLSATAGPGRRGAPALLLLHHMDVVPARPERWSAKPFDGAMRNGYVWGRGAIDDKGLGVIHLMAFILLKRLGIPLKRDVIFLAVADEEEGGEFGTQWMIRNHWPEIECQYVWDEGGTGSQGVMGNRPVFAISVSEKRRLLVRLVASGQSGHASMAAGTPIDRLINALYSLQRYRPGIGFNEMTREFFAKIAQTQPFPASWLLRRAAHPVVSPLIARRLARVPSINAMLRDTLTATVVNAGQKANVSPDTAEAVLDARLLPDTDTRSFMKAISKRQFTDQLAACQLAWSFQRSISGLIQRLAILGTSPWAFHSLSRWMVSPSARRSSSTMDSMLSSICTSSGKRSR